MDLSRIRPDGLLLSFAGLQPNPTSIEGENFPERTWADVDELVYQIKIKRLQLLRDSISLWKGNTIPTSFSEGSQDKISLVRMGLA